MYTIQTIGCCCSCSGERTFWIHQSCRCTWCNQLLERVSASDDDDATAEEEKSRRRARFVLWRRNGACRPSHSLLGAFSACDDGTCVLSQFIMSFFYMQIFCVLLRTQCCFVHFCVQSCYWGGWSASWGFILRAGGSGSGGEAGGESGRRIGFFHPCSLPADLGRISGQPCLGLNGLAVPILWWLCVTQVFQTCVVKCKPTEVGYSVSFVMSGVAVSDGAPWPDITLTNEVNNAIPQTPGRMLSLHVWQHSSNTE